MPEAKRDISIMQADYEALRQYAVSNRDYIIEPLLDRIESIKQSFEKRIKNNKTGLLKEDACKYFDVQLQDGVVIWNSTDADIICKSIAYDWQVVSRYINENSNQNLSNIDNGLQRYGRPSSKGVYANYELVKRICTNAGLSPVAPQSAPNTKVKDADGKRAEQQKAKAQEHDSARENMELRKKDSPAGQDNPPATTPPFPELAVDLRQSDSNQGRGIGQSYADAVIKDDNLPSILLPDTIDDCLEIIPKKYIVDGVIEAGSIVMIAGKEKIGKTYALKHLALCMASEKPWMGKATMKDEHGGILWVNLDMKRATALRRVNEITHGLCESWHCAFSCELFPSFYLLHSETFRKQGLDNLTFDGNAERSVDEMERMIEDPKYNIKVCFIDSMVELEGDLDENKAGDIGKFFRRIYDIRDKTGCTFILIHHNTKSGDRGRGSSAIFGATELNLQLSQDVTNHDILLLSTDGARDTAENNIGMKKVWRPRLNNDGTEMKDEYGNPVFNFLLEPVDARTVSTTATEKAVKKQEASNKRIEQKVLDALRGVDEGLSKNQICAQAHISRNDGMSAVDRLCDRNELITLENGKYRLP